MYKFLIRPLLFKIDPEKVHHLIVFFLKTFFKIPGLKQLFALIFNYNHPSLQTNFLGLKFKSPIGLAAGFDKDAKIFNEFSSFGFSFIEIGTVTPKPQQGNPKPRIFRIPQDKALINRMGFNNLGVDQAVERLKKRNKSIIIGGNIGKNTATPNENAIDDYDYCFRKLYDCVDYFVINVSCPNVTDLGKLQDRESLGAIMQRLIDIRMNQQIRKPILLKISPDLNMKQVDDAIEISVEKGIDGFVVSNTTITRNNLTIESKRIDEIGKGGMSGLPIASKSTKLIKYIADKTQRKMPIIGVGGIMNEKEAIEKLRAGASLIQIYTGFIYEGPGFVKKIKKALVAANMNR
jgi:dihydroorotate dehydrogenase